MQPFMVTAPKVRRMLVATFSERIATISSWPSIGGFQLWLMVDITVAIAPSGAEGVPALSHASAKQVVLVTKLPFTQATEKMKGCAVVLVRSLLILVTEKLEVTKLKSPP